MKSIYLILIFSFFSLALFAANTLTTQAVIFPASTISSEPEMAEKSPVSKIANLNIREVEELLGRKMSFKEKVVFKLSKWKLKNEARQKDKKGNDGTASVVLGIAGIVIALIPVINVIAIPFSILSLIFGYNAKKKNPQSKKAKAGILLGWIGLGIIALTVILYASLFSGFRFG